MTGLAAARSPAQPASSRALFVLYIVIFIGFLGYSLMITVFTPMLLDGHGAMLPAATPEARRTILLGFTSPERRYFKISRLPLGTVSFGFATRSDGTSYRELTYAPGMKTPKADI